MNAMFLNGVGVGCVAGVIATAMVWACCARKRRGNEGEELETQAAFLLTEAKARKATEAAQRALEAAEAHENSVQTQGAQHAAVTTTLRQLRTLGNSGPKSGKQDVKGFIERCKTFIKEAKEVAYREKGNSFRLSPEEIGRIRTKVHQKIDDEAGLSPDKKQSVKRALVPHLAS